MTVLEAIKNRFSVRKYSSKPVDEKDLNAILEAARCSQSAKNIQDWRFIIVRDEALRSKLADAAKGQRFVGEAPVVIVCCGINPDYIMSCGQYSYTLDVAIAMENMALVAYERGLGTCWLGSFYENQVKNVLSIPEDDVRVVGMLTLGYPTLESTLRGKIKKSPLSPIKKRHSLETIVKYEKW